MSRDLARTLRRFVHPRSRRSELWADVYRAAFVPEDEGETTDDSPSRAAD